MWTGSCRACHQTHLANLRRPCCLALPSENSLCSCVPAVFLPPQKRTHPEAHAFSKVDKTTTHAKNLHILDLWKESTVGNPCLDCVDWSGWSHLWFLVCVVTMVSCLYHWPINAWMPAAHKHSTPLCKECSSLGVGIACLPFQFLRNSS